MSRATELAIRTPEGVLFTIPLAGPIARGVAVSVDVAVVLAAASVLRSAAAALALVSPDAAVAVTAAAYFAFSIGYGIATEWLWRGQTLGKRLLGLRVVDAQGLRLQPAQIVIRNLLRPVDALPAFYLVGGAACLLSPKAQRLGDLAANTVVVRRRRTLQPDLDRIRAGRFNSLREALHLAARLRQLVSPEEATLALQAVLRRGRLDTAARLALFAEMASHFRELVPFPAELADGLSDEQYVRNVVELLYAGTRV